MIPSTTLLAMATAAALASAAPAASAAACATPRVGPSVAASPEPWQRAIDALVQATRAEGLPWSCPGGAVDLVVHDRGATLTVVSDDGRTITREVASPDDVVPLGQALLARPLPPPAPKPPAEPPPPTEAALAPANPPAPPPAPQTPPRALLSALVAPRYAGRTNLLWGGITAAAAVPFGPWGAGAWVRYDALSASLDGTGTRMSEVCVGAAALRAFTFGRFELRASVTPSVAILTRSFRRFDETRVDGRVGADARGLFTLTSWLRAVVALDAELAPRGLGRADRVVRDGDEQYTLSPFPAYTLGLGAGVELTIR